MPSQGPRCLSLCDSVVLVVWSLPVPVEGPSSLAGTFGEPITPISSLKLAEEAGGTRVVWAMPRPAEDAVTFLAAAGGESSVPVEYVAAETPPVAETLFAGLTPEARLQLSSAVLGSWTNLFRLHRSPSFVRSLRTLFRTPSEKSGIQIMFAAGGVAVIEVATPRRFGSLKASHFVYAQEMREVKLTPMSVRPADRTSGIRRYFCGMPAGATPSLVIIRSENGLVVRDWPDGSVAPAIETWWKKSGARDLGLREECVGLLNAHSPTARAASIEFQLRCPLRQHAVVGSTDLPSARIELALAGSKGLLVGGWYRDPAGFLAGFDVLDHDDAAHSLDAGRVDFAGKIPGPDDKPLDASGFIGFVPDIRGPLQQPRFLMRLRSGVRHLLVPPVQPIDWPAARAAALRAVPPQALSDNVIATCLAPVLGEYQEAARRSIGAPTVKQIGTPVENPVVSLIIPLYRVLDFLPFQIAAFASDPQVLFRCELIYVLDSPEQADAVEHLLTGLHLVYGIPITLAVMGRNGGYAIANNRGAALARGDVLALVNSDVIPIEGGWVGALEQRLSSEVVGAVGPKLLYEDDSIQHAGLFFAEDHRGRWLNQHYFKGMPRHYRPAAAERSVPGITGACMVVRRALFEKVGGFTEDYVIGDYEDSDLCLKIRAQGHDIVYVPDAELYHLERRSMAQSTDYMRGVAAQYNSWLHQQRWGDAMRALMDQHTALSSPRLGNVA
jgi:GT2 family glycosyltransferase